jgi:hypothetical protein
MAVSHWNAQDIAKVAIISIIISQELGCPNIVKLVKSYYESAKSKVLYTKKLPKSSGIPFMK